MKILDVILKKINARKASIFTLFFVLAVSFVLLVPFVSKKLPPGQGPVLSDLPGSYLKVDVSEQMMYFYKEGEVFKTYSVSTSKFGTGSRKGSQKTPLGRHRIAKKIGKNAAPNSIFKNRVNTGATAQLSYDKSVSKGDFITSRILWLEGLEEGVNKGGRVDSFDRFIYIHGTADEGLIGVPASHGCVRMKNADVIELFNLIGKGTIVDIGL